MESFKLNKYIEKVSINFKKKKLESAANISLAMEK